MSRFGARVFVASLVAGLVAAPAVGHAAATETGTAVQSGCLFGVSTGLTMVAPSVIDGSAFAAPLFVTQTALLASPAVQFAAAAGVVALSFCYAGQAIAPLYTHLTQAD